MSKQWYYEVMGSPVGPISSAELKQGVLSRRILPETRLRLGTDGKWQTADRVKGLFDAPAAASAPASKSAAAPLQASAKPEAATVELAAVETAEIKIPLAGVTPAAAPTAPAVEEVDDGGSKEYDFFKFVGFEEAIGSALNRLLVDYCRVHHLTMAQATRRALAEFLGRKDLGGDPAFRAGSPPPPESLGIS